MDTGDGLSSTCRFDTMEPAISYVVCGEHALWMQVPSAIELYVRRLVWLLTITKEMVVEWIMVSVRRLNNGVMRMSKRKAIFAKDLRAGDVVRLVYEIEVREIVDLDTVIPSESSNLFFIKSTVVRGPMRGKEGEFAINGEDKLDILIRKSWWDRMSSRFAEYSKHFAAKPCSKASKSRPKKTDGDPKEAKVFEDTT